MLKTNIDLFRDEGKLDDGEELVWIWKSTEKCIIFKTNKADVGSLSQAEGYMGHCPLLIEINQINDSLTNHFYEGYIKALFRCPGSCNEQIIISTCIE